MRSAIFFSLSLSLFVGCSLFISGKESIETAKGKLYRIKDLPKPWMKPAKANSDYLFTHSDGSSFVANSFCKEFQDEPLEELAKKTFRGLKEVKFGKSEELQWKNREAFRLVGTGKMDGVDITMMIQNIRRDHCYFDYLLIKPKTKKISDNEFTPLLEYVEFM